MDQSFERARANPSGGLYVKLCASQTHQYFVVQLISSVSFKNPRADNAERGHRAVALILPFLPIELSPRPRPVLPLSEPSNIPQIAAPIGMAASVTVCKNKGQKYVDTAVQFGVENGPFMWKQDCELAMRCPDNAANIDSPDPR